MTRNSKIVLQQHWADSPTSKGELRYKVVALINRTRPMIGEPLHEVDVHHLMETDPNLTVEVNPFDTSKL